MAGISPIRRAIAKAIARGKPKTAARIEADHQIRQGLWKAHEERVLKMMAGGTGERGTDNAQTILHDGLVDAYDHLIRAGYTKERAAALVQRLATRANKHQLEALRGNMATPVPKIRGQSAAEAPEAKAGIPVLVRAPIADQGAREFLLKQYPNIKAGTIVEYNGKLYQRTVAQAATGDVPSFVELESHKHIWYPKD